MSNKRGEEMKFTALQIVDKALIKAHPDVIPTIVDEKIIDDLARKLGKVLDEGKPYVVAMPQKEITENYRENTVEYRRNLQYVPLVTCKECVHRMSPDMGRFCIGRHENFWCAYGERRIDPGNIYREVNDE